MDADARARRPDLPVVLVSAVALIDVDGRVLALLDAAAVNYQVVLTKMDKVKPEARRHLLAGLGQALARHPAAHPQILPTSSANGEGMAALRAEISTLAQAL